MAFDSGLSDAGKAYIRDNPLLLSLLYGANCLPEAVVATKNPARRATMLTAVIAFALGSKHEDPNLLLNKESVE